MKGLCHTCKSSNVETVIDQKTGSPICFVCKFEKEKTKNGN